MCLRAVSRTWGKYQETCLYTRGGGGCCGRGGSRTAVSSFMEGGRERPLLECYEVTSSRPHVCMFLPKLRNTDSMGVAWSPQMGHLLTVKYHPSVRPSTGAEDPGFLSVWKPRPIRLEDVKYVSIFWMIKVLMWLSGRAKSKTKTNPPTSLMH